MLSTSSWNLVGAINLCFNQLTFHIILMHTKVWEPLTLRYISVCIAELWDVAMFKFIGYYQTSSKLVILVYSHLAVYESSYCSISLLTLQNIQLKFFCQSDGCETARF
jgi:hypothetical protein